MKSEPHSSPAPQSAWAAQCDSCPPAASRRAIPQGCNLPLLLGFVLAGSVPCVLFLVHVARCYLAFRIQLTFFISAASLNLPSSL